MCMKAGMLFELSFDPVMFVGLQIIKYQIGIQIQRNMVIYCPKEHQELLMTMAVVESGQYGLHQCIQSGKCESSEA